MCIDFTPHFVWSWQSGSCKPACWAPKTNRFQFSQSCERLRRYYLKQCKLKFSTFYLFLKNIQVNTLNMLNSCPNKIEFHLRLLHFLNTVDTTIVLLSSKQLGFVSEKISIIKKASLLLSLRSFQKSFSVSADFYVHIAARSNATFKTNSNFVHRYRATATTGISYRIL